MNKSNKDMILDEAVKYAYLCRDHAANIKRSNDELPELRKSGHLVLDALQSLKANGEEPVIKFVDKDGHTFRIELAPGKDSVSLTEDTSEDEVIAWLKQHDLGATCVMRKECLNLDALKALRKSQPDAFRAAGLKIVNRDWLSLSCDDNKLTPYGR